MAANDKKFIAMAKSILKAELKRREVSYKQLAGLLAGIGVNESERNLGNKIGRGTFSAAFFLQCLTVIGVRRLDIEEVMGADA